MFEFLSVEHPDQIKNLIHQFDPQQTTWIVSDLKSKQSLQNRCLEQYGYYTDESILRISDFWKTWLRRLAPQMHVVSGDFIRILVKQYVEDYGGQLGLQKQEATTLIRYLNDLAPLLLHPTSETNLQEWFEKQQHPCSWQKWFILAQSCLNFIVEDKRSLDAKWIVSFLQRVNLQKFSWDKEIIVDLGSEMSSVEMGLLNILAQKTKVTILVPNPQPHPLTGAQWKNKFQYLLRTYKDYEGFSQKNNLPRIQQTMSLRPEMFMRFSTELAEIKFATMKVRSWIDQGVLPNQIALVSPRLEDYWPILKMHLDYEGIVTTKDTVSSMTSLGVVQNLLAKLKTESEDPTWESLEVSYFQEQDSTRQYEKFKALFFELTDAEDFKRDEKIKNIFYKKIEYTKKTDREEFLAVILKYWLDLDKSDQAVDLLEPLFKDFIAQTTNVTISFTSWLEVFSARLSSKEIKIEKSAAEGVQVRPLNASHLMEVTHRIWLGLDEGGLRSKSQSLIPISDIEELKRDFDLALDYPEESHAEFNLYWLSQTACTEQFFTTAHVGIQSDPLSTPLFLLENNIKPDVQISPETRLDQLQKNQTASVKLQRDMKLVENDVDGFKPKKFSSTDLINYAQCEFKLLASKGFRLRDYANVSVDLDPRQKGTLVHALFEWMVQQDRYLDVSSEQIAAFLEGKRTELGLFPVEDIYWAAQKKRFQELAQKFMIFEKERLLSNPVQHLTEVEFNILFSEMEITGRIDRIDVNPRLKEAVIYDYKSSNSSGTNYAKHWLDKLEYQMLFYMMALEQTLLPGIEAKAAFYYFYKKMAVYKGFVQAEAENIQSMVDLRKNALMTADDQAGLMGKFKTTLEDLFLKIKKGSYMARPVEIKICSDCDWRKLCRAPHLN